MDGFSPAPSLLRRLTSRFNARKIVLRQYHISPTLGQEIEAEIARFEQDLDNDDPIILEIRPVEGEDQPGSNLALESLHEAIKTSRVGVWGLVMGTCQFSAMYVLQSCQYRMAVPEATFKFHDMRVLIPVSDILRYVDVFPDDDIESTLRILRRLLERYKAFVTAERRTVAKMYKRRIPSLELDVLVSYMREEKELSAYQALALGIIDRIERIPPVVH